MNRNLHIERVFNLGDYKSIRFSDEIEDLPQDLMFNEDLIAKIRFLQMLNVDLAYWTYRMLNEKTYNLNPEDTIKYLEEVKVTTFNEIKEIMNGKLKGE